MEKLLKMQQKLIPQVIDIMKRRYYILRQISISEPVGRRTLSNTLGISERIIRSETEFLKEQGLIDVAGSGMNITNEGSDLLEELKLVISSIMGVTTTENKLKEKLKIKKVIIVPGDFDENQTIIKDISKHASEYFLNVIKDTDIVSITGGSTMLEFSQTIKSDKKYSEVTIVPARGSMGKDVETQSNNVVAIASKGINSNYKLLNIPDELDEKSLQTLSQIPEIKTTLDYIQKTEVLVFGIGRADEMATRRKLSQDKIDEILSKGAVGEAFGYYFNKDGEIVYRLNTVGIDLETFNNTRENIAIFGGSKKAEAFIALSNINKNLVLVTDEKSANKILDLI